MITRNIKILLSTFALLPAAYGAPTALDDLSGLGNSKVAAALRSSIFLGESTVNKSITKLVNSEGIQPVNDAKKNLIDLGFSCPSSGTFCQYQGTAITYVKGEAGSEQKSILINVTLRAAIGDEKIDVTTNLNRTISKWD